MRVSVNTVRIHTIIRVLLGLVFVWASWDKIFNPQAFAGIIENYKILPDILIWPVAVILPWLEIISGALLISGYMVRGSAFIINVLTLTFIIALTCNLYRGIDITCGCFSLLARSSNTYMLLIRDIVILITGIWVLFFHVNRNSGEFRTWNFRAER